MNETAQAETTDERPGARELLEVARETLLAEVLPALDGDGRYQVLMIANAMAIAMREMAPGPVDVDAEVAGLRGLYETPEASPAGESPEQALQRLEARLVRDLRDGVLDGGPQYAVRRWLRLRLEARLAVSNPRALERRGREDDRA
jgi:hypothetical protein